MASNSSSTSRSLTPAQTQRQQFLHFSLEPHTQAMLPIAQLSEVLNVPLGQIVPIPHLPPWVLGVYNWRGEILWMVDLGQLLGLTPWHRQSVTRSSYAVIVLNGSGDYDPKRPLRRQSRQDRNQMLGLVVGEVKDIEWCHPDQIQSAPTASISTALVPYLRGFWVSEPGEMFVVLNGQAVISRLNQTSIT
jgi:positive phototaxis protein PixI